MLPNARVPKERANQGIELVEVGCACYICAAVYVEHDRECTRRVERVDRRGLPSNVKQCKAMPSNVKQCQALPSIC